jgi:hypothetical protein
MYPQDSGDDKIVSSRLLSVISTSTRLRRMLVPQSLATSPYEVIDYASTLVLHDGAGKRATFLRQQKIRFLQHGVSGILDHAWGEGILLTKYRNTAGSLEDSFRDGGRRHLVIGLKRPMSRGEDLSFQVEREAMEAFLQNEEWLETTIDHPIGKLGACIVFPKRRPVRRAVLRCNGLDVLLPTFELRDGRTMVGFHRADPRADTSYTIHWLW